MLTDNTIILTNNDIIIPPSNDEAINPSTNNTIIPLSINDTTTALTKNTVTALTNNAITTPSIIVSSPPPTRRLTMTQVASHNDGIYLFRLQVQIIVV